MAEEENKFKVVDTGNAPQKTGPNLFDELPMLKKVPPKYLKKQYVWAFLLGFFLVSFMMGALMFGGGSGPKMPNVPYLTGIVPNPDIPDGRRRCGTVS